MGKRRAPAKFSDAERIWIYQNRSRPRPEAHAEFVTLWNRADVSLEQYQGLCKREGWKVGKAGGAATKGRSTVFSEAERAWISENHTLPAPELHAEFCKAFPGTKILKSQLVSYRKRAGLKPAGTGRYEKGNVPWTKGLKLGSQHGGKTQFKKGERTGAASLKWQPIGTEKVRDGYLVRKVNEGRPFYKRWQFVHIIRWEEAHGPVPEGHVLKCLDGNRLNTAPGNWTAIPRGVLSRLNGKSGRDYDHAPDELRSIILKTAMLEHAIGQALKSNE